MPQKSVMVVIHAGKALILQRGSTAPWKPGLWNLPGGLADQGESPLDAAIREAEEEADVKVSNVRFLARYPQQGGELFAYTGQAADDQVTIRATHGIIESDAWEWVDASTMHQYQYAVPVIVEIIRKGLESAQTDERDTTKKG